MPIFLNICLIFDPNILDLQYNSFGIPGRSSEREKKLLESVVRDNEITFMAVMLCDVINTHKRQWQS